MPETKDLLFYFSDDFDEDMVREMKALVQRLTDSYTWKCGPPEFVDETLRAESDSDDDIRTVGGALQIAAASAPADTDWEAERIHFQEVSRIVEELRRMTSALQTEVELQLGDVYVGDIRDGVVGRTLQVGLLDEWAARLP
jgi:hypothetical protein